MGHSTKPSDTTYRSTLFFYSRVDTAPPSSGHRNPPLTSRERVEKEVLLNVYGCIACVWLALVVFTSAMFSQTTLDQITFSQISYKSHLDKPHSANHPAKSHSVKSRTAYLGLSTCVLFLQPTTFN